MYPLRLHTFSEHLRISFVQYLMSGHALSGMPVYWVCMARTSSSVTRANGNRSK